MLLLLSALGVVSPSSEYAGKRLAVVHGDGIRAGGISLAQEPGTRYIDSTRLLRRTTRLLAFRTDFSRFVIVDRIGLSIELIRTCSERTGGRRENAACTPTGGTAQRSWTPERSGSCWAWRDESVCPLRRLDRRTRPAGLILPRGRAKGRRRRRPRAPASSNDLARLRERDGRAAHLDRGCPIVATIEASASIIMAPRRRRRCAAAPFNPHARGSEESGYVRLALVPTALCVSVGCMSAGS